MNGMPAAPGRDTRTRVVEAFTARLADQGYLGVSLDAVASDVGVRKASLYHHFPGGKEELFRAAGLAYVAHEEARVVAALAAAPGLEERLVAEGRMTPAGLAAVESAKRDGSWETLDSVDALEVPEDLRAALDAHPGARAGFDGLSASARKMALYWIASASMRTPRPVGGATGGVLLAADPVSWTPTERRIRCPTWPRRRRSGSGVASRRSSRPRWSSACSRAASPPARWPGTST